MASKVVRPATRLASSFSYVHATSSVPFLPLTLGQVLQRAVEAKPDRDFVVFPRQEIRKTYEQFYTDARQIAAGFYATGLKQGDRVGIWAPNVYEWVLTQFACALGGFTLVNINPGYKPRELHYAIAKVQCKGIVSSLSFKSSDYLETIFELCPELATSKPGQLKSRRLPSLRNVYLISPEKHDGCFLFTDLYDAAGSQSAKHVDSLQINSDDPVNIQFTSGTTGYPKGVLLTHHNIVNNAHLTGRRMEVHEQEHLKVCCPPPLYHCFGCVLATLLSAVFHGTVVFPAPSFEPGPTLQQVDAENCTALYGTPTMFIDMLNHPDFDKYDYSTLITGIMAGAPCPVEVVKACIEKLNMSRFVVGYGTTENSPITTMTMPHDEIEKRTQTVGRVMDHTEAKVVDQDGRTVPCGERGTLMIRGYCVMLGYDNDHEQTAEAIDKSGWYNTGDIATIDGEGYCSIVGRERDMIIRGGENVYPVEIEQVIFEHPSVEDVHVVGVPDKRMGEEICAWVRLHKGAVCQPEEIKHFVKSRMAHFKVPKYVVFKEETDFPITVTGKVQKYKIKEIARHELGLEHEASHV